MTREKAKEICDMIETHGIEVIKAYGEGRVIQHLNLDGEWIDCDMPIAFSNNHSFRIKPDNEIKPEENFVYKYGDKFVIMDVRLPLIKESPLFEGSLEECNKWIDKKETGNESK